ncbi:MAG: Zn-ribbon domain-containing OB-fold protein [Caulobacteraceae bacterium]
MDEVTLLKPTLYRAAGTAEAPDRPALLGAVCGRGHVFFPLQRYGCERCGSLDLEPRALCGLGRLLASARVRLHAGKGREAPFTVGSIQLDDGPIVRTLIEAGEDMTLGAGTRMATTLVAVVDADGRGCLDLRFEPAPAK